MASAPCSLVSLYAPMSNALTSSYLKPCFKEIGVDYTAYCEGVFPTTEQFQKFALTADCQSFYKDLQANLLKIPECTLTNTQGTINIHQLSNVPIQNLLAFTYPISHQNSTTLTPGIIQQLNTRNTPLPTTIVSSAKRQFPWLSFSIAIMIWILTL
ncbi:hypothetical protein THRCLA_08047 [Thraustotheca clavata]|uniref:Elicitin n=1 Tax=Thraustotheca clavata TaxID=74557 RepID=A0A1V9ZAG4_9STRA|nr:hypothetical protein THRCLA_08047 [Thraustotheca clavata]